MQTVKIQNAPVFDLVRASINLVVASGLIAIATANKMPLSTTYVSYMVAMGTSLSDSAWGLGSAVYRVIGVLNVIGGWFFTGFVAFLIAALFALVMKFVGIGGIIILVLLAGWSLFRTHRLHRRNTALAIKAGKIKPIKKNEDLQRVSHFMGRSFEVLQECLVSVRNDHHRKLSFPKKDGQ